MMRNKDKTKTTYTLYLPLLPRFNFTHDSSTSSHPKQHRGMRNGSCSRFLTLRLCHSFLFTLFPCSGMDSLP